MSDQGIGAPVLRKEDKRFLTGKGNYTDDINRPNQTHAYILRSNVAHAEIKSIDTAAAAKADEVLLAFGAGAPGSVLNLSAGGDLTEAAANLFAYLRRLDAPGVVAIAVMPIPETGLGRAINDRLQRAANRQ